MDLPIVRKNIAISSRDVSRRIVRPIIKETIKRKKAPKGEIRNSIFSQSFSPYTPLFPRPKRERKIRKSPKETFGLVRKILILKKRKPREISIIGIKKEKRPKLSAST